MAPSLGKKFGNSVIMINIAAERGFRRKKKWETELSMIEGKY